MKDEGQRIVGIGLAENIELAWADINPDGSYRSKINLLSVPLPDPADGYEIDMKKGLASFLAWAKDAPESREIFDGKTVRVGVSSIGRVDREARRLVRIVRKPWKKHGTPAKNNEHVIDFARMVSTAFKINKSHVFANNDATCAAIAEVQRLDAPRNAHARNEIYFYITLNEGVNVGIVNRRSEVRFSEHPELGHAFPRPHPSDLDIAVPNACRAHGRCYEALASAARIRETWGIEGGPGANGDLADFDEGHEAWSVIGFYIAQLCLMGHSVFYPKRIILGGTVMWGQNPSGADCPRARYIHECLMPEVWRWYAQLHGFYPISSADPWDHRDPLEAAKDLIERGSIYTMTNAQGGLALARLDFLNLNLMAV